MNEKDIKSLLLLLEDPDPKVYKVIKETILNNIHFVKPYLENSFTISSDVLFHSRIQSLLDEIEAQGSIDNFKVWLSNKDASLIDALIIVDDAVFFDQIHTPTSELYKKLKQAVWIEVNKNLTAIEKVKILNKVLYDDFALRKTTPDVVRHEQFSINYLLSNKDGNPLMHSLLYACVAQDIGMPIYLLALPDLYAVGYKDSFIAELSLATVQHYDVVFYIHPYEKGALFNHSVIRKYIEEKHLEPKQEYFSPLSNKETMLEYLTLLSKSLQVQNNSTLKSGLIKQMIDLLSF